MIESKRNVPAKIDLDRVAFYGRCLDEYRLFFNLDLEEFQGKQILDCPSGAASFAAEANKIGIHVTAVDPLFDKPIEELRAIGERDLAHVMEKARAVPDMYSWNYFRTYSEMEATRNRSLNLFEEDFRSAGPSRYIPAFLPKLPFATNQFDVVLSGHFSFCYGDRFTPEFHIDSIRELARVSSNEVRIYPLKGLDAKPYPFYQQVVDELAKLNIRCEHRPSAYQFIRGWDELAVFKKEDNKH